MLASRQAASQRQHRPAAISRAGPRFSHHTRILRPRVQVASRLMQVSPHAFPSRQTRQQGPVPSSQPETLADMERGRPARISTAASLRIIASVLE